ncbi:MAG TPA: metalloregulator ArsR/SmtB family transcription factor [Edaphobacter sp.]|nr:metalloregulator ArsR/SmtB family transcription factor [Edaphobacter sp.]
MTSQAQLDHVFSALADATRRAILARLVQGEATVNELVEPFDLKQPTISKHLKVLERAGLVSRGREAQFRPVRLNAAPLAYAAKWIGSYRRLWEDSFDRLDALLGSKQPTPKKGKQNGRKL